MKKKLINLLLTLSMAFAVIGFVGCKDDKPDDTQSSVESTIPPSSEDSTPPTSEQPPEKENFTGITFPDKTVTYNGNAHSLELVGVPTFATINYDKETSYTNAGTYTVKATITAENYNSLELSATLTIEKATVEGISFAGETYTYDGTAKSLAITGNLPDGVTVAYENNAQTNAGEYTVTATFTVNGNYNAIPDKTATLKINKATYDMSGVTYTNTTATYDGQPHTITVGNLPNGVTASVEEKTNAGMHNVTVTFTGDSQNYNPISSVVKTLNIQKATYDMSGVTYTGTTATYDGQPHTITVGNLPDGVTASVEQKSCINADSYDLLVTFTGDSTNYNPIDSVTQTLTIHKATVEGIAFNGATYTYDGTEKSLAITGNLPDGVSVSYENNDQINADTYTVTAKFTVNGNYNAIPDKTATLVIQKAGIQGISFAGATYTYDGTEKSLAITGELPDGVSVSYENNDQINAKTYTVKAVFTVNGNYNAIPDMTATLTIEKKELIVAFSGETALTYTGEVQKTISATPTNLVDGDSVQITLTYSGEMIEKGDYTVTASIDEQNYKLTQNNTVQVKISRAVHTLTFKQEGFADVTLTVNDLEDITARIPETQTITGYNIVWVWGENDYTSVTDSWTITAQKTAIEYTVAYINSGTSVENITTYTVEDEDILLNIPENGKGMMFDGWYDENDELIESLDTATASNRTITAKWDTYRIEKATGFTIDYTPTQPTISITLPNAETVLTLDDKITVSRGCSLELYVPTITTANRQPTNDLYDLQEEENTGYLVVRHPSGKTLSYVLTVYRQAIRSYTFMNGESTHHSGTIEETYTINAPETEPMKTAYTFSHWSVNGEMVEFPYTITEDTVFTAEYTPTEYTITLELAGGSLAESTLKYHIETETFTLPTTATRDYYTFAGWKYNGNSISQITQGSYGDKTITASWTPITYYVTYEVNGGETLAKTPFTVEYGITLKTPTREHYDFVEWQYEGEKIEEIPVGWHGDKTITAIWTPHIYTVSYNFDGGVEIEQPVTSVHIEQLPLSLNTQRTHKDNAVFDGWYLDKEFTLSATQLTEAKDTVIYVKWIQATEGLQYEGNAVTDYTGTATKVIIAEWYNGVQITTIGASAFEDCSSLTSIVIPDSVTKIGWSAFEGCSSLTSIVIPDSVTTIGEDAFRGCSSLTSIVIPDGVTSIDWGVFCDCDGLTSINIPDSVTTIGSYAFYDCDGLTSVMIGDSVTTIGWHAFYNCSSLESIVIPDSVTSIGESAFYDCSSLTSIEFGESSQLTTIGSYAFYDCDGLTSVMIGDSVTSIGEDAFRGCSSLASITVSVVNSVYQSIDGNLYTKDAKILFQYACGKNATTFEIPDGVTTIDSYAFAYCRSLTSIVIPDSVTTIDSYAFAYCRSLTSIVIPDSVTTIGNYAFYDCDGLTSIKIPDSVTTIGNYAFSDCSSLTSVVIGNGVITIGECAFYDCDGLTSIKIPDSVTTIGNYAFSDCSSLTSVVIGNGVITIGERAFYDCDSLTSIVIPDSVTTISEFAFYNCSSLTIYCEAASKPSGWNYYYWNYSNRPVVWNYAGTTVIEDGIRYALTNDGTMTVYGYEGTATEIEIASAVQGYSVTAINQKAFYEKSSLTSITIPDGVTTIGSFAFYDCSGLTSVTIGNSVTSIGERAFYNCSSLTSIVIPNSVTSIGSYAFYDCDGLTKVNYTGTIDDWAMIDFGNADANPLYYAKKLYINDVEVTDVVLTKATEINAYAFYGCSSLTSIVIPDSVTTIGSSAFRNCSSLTIYCEAASKPSDWNYYWNYSGCPVIWNYAGTTVIEDGIRYALTNDDTMTVYGYEGTATEVEIASTIQGYSVTTIASSAFYNCSRLTSVTIGDSVTTIGSYAFSYCGSLTSVTIGDSVTTIGSYAFSGCSDLTSVTIGDSVTTIGSYAFSGCSGLTSVTIGNSVTTIGSYAFYNCSRLTSVTIGDSVTTIGSSAFYNCSRLTSVTIGDSVTTIGSSAFYNCSSLMSIEIPDSVTSIGSYAFDSCSRLTKVNYMGTIDQWAMIDFGNSSANPLYYTEKLYINDVEVTDVVLTKATEINAYAFYGCSSLTSIEIPDGVTSIDSYAFSGCSSLTNVYYGGTSEQWSSISIGSYNTCLTNATRYYYSADEPTLNAEGTAYDGNYWHYDNNGEIVIWTKETVVTE